MPRAPPANHTPSPTSHPYDNRINPAIAIWHDLPRHLRPPLALLDDWNPVRPLNSGQQPPSSVIHGLPDLNMDGPLPTFVHPPKPVVPSLHGVPLPIPLSLEMENVLLPFVNGVSNTIRQSKMPKVSTKEDKKAKPVMKKSKKEKDPNKPKR